MIATYNSARTIEHTLSSIVSNRFPRDLFEVLVVDDGSADNTLELAENFPVDVYPCTHLGHGSARNLGIKKAKGDIICLTDSDIIVPDTWLKKIWDYFDSHSDVDAIGGPILPPSDDYYESDIQKLTAEIYYEDQVFPTEDMRIQTFEWKTYLASANSAYRKEALTSVGGFPESQVIKTNDMYVMWRLVEKGRTLVFLPELKVSHLGFPTTLSGIFRQQFGWGKGKAITTRAYNYRHPRKISCTKEELRKELYPPYALTKALVQIPLRSPRDKQMLRCCHLAFYYLGLLYGRGFKVESSVGGK